MQFPIAARFGVETLHFGTSTGVARLDTLSIGTPLTTEVFENRQTAEAWNSPGQPRRGNHRQRLSLFHGVSPLVVAPAVSQLARWLGYTPLPDVRSGLSQSHPLRPVTLLRLSHDLTRQRQHHPQPHHDRRLQCSLGFRTRGNCGVPYDELRNSLICPWTLDFHVDYDTRCSKADFCIRPTCHS